MKKLFGALAAILVLALTACEQPTNDDNQNGKLPRLTIRNLSSFDLTDVKFSSVPFSVSGSNDLPQSTQEIRQLTANDVKEAGYITFIRKDIGIACRIVEPYHITEDRTITILDTFQVEEVGNSSNKKSLSQITFQSTVSIERDGRAVVKNDTIPLGEITVNIPTTAEFTLKNTGVGKLLLAGNEPVKVTGDGANDFSVVQPVSSEIAPNSSLTFKINLNLKTEQSYNVTVTVSSNDQNGNFTFTITATGVPSRPIASVFYEDTPIHPQTGAINAGEVFITQSKNITIVIKNTGTALLTLDTANISITGTDREAFARTTNPGGNIPAGNQTQFDIKCAPEKQGENNATLTIPTNDDSHNPITVYLKVTGVKGSAVLKLNQGDTVIANNSLTPLDFGRVALESNKPLVFTIQNTGNIDLELTGNPLVESSNAVFVIQTQPTNKTISSNDDVSFIIRYTPTAEREDTGTLTIYNNSDDMVFSFPVKGTGYIPVPQITVRQGAASVNPFGEYDFGNVELGRTSDVTFTIGNSGDANLTFVTIDGNRINLSDNSSNIFSVIQQPSATTAVVPGGTAIFIVRFSPNMVESVFTATVKIKTNSRDNEDFSFTVKGGSYEVEPAAPAGVTATAESANSIMVSWNPVPGATSYKVYYGTNNSSITILVSSAVTGTSYTHTGLEANTTLYYRVVAVNGAGDSDYSSSVSAKTRINAPTGVSATAQSTSSISVSWNPLSGAASYKVYYTTGNSSGTKILASTVTTTSYTHTGLQAGTTYYYFVAAVSGSDESDYSNYSYAAVLPAAPTGVNATTQSASSIRVQWNSVTGATSYRVYYATGSSSGNKIQAGTATTTSYNHTGLQGSTTYYYFIVAVNNSGNSDYSSYASATTQIAVPTGVSASGQSTSSIRVQWNSVTGATSYRIYYSDTQTGPKTLLTSTSGTSYTHTGLQAAQGYYYFITAVNSSGSESEYSSYAYAYTNFL